MTPPTPPRKTFLGLPKVPARYATFVMQVLLSLLMTFVVSLISTLRALGPSPDFFRLWFGAWGLSWLVGFPTLVVVMPIVRRLTAALTETP